MYDTYEEKHKKKNHLTVLSLNFVSNNIWIFNSHDTNTDSTLQNPNH